MTFFYFLLIVVILTLIEFRYSKGSSSLDPNCNKLWPKCLEDSITLLNTACMFKNCAPRDPNCKELLADDKFRKAVLNEHNKLRNKIASGNDKTGKNQAASNMRALSYDLGLEYTSICHVHGCREGHDKCRITTRFKNVGQNAGMLEVSGQPRYLPSQLNDLTDISSSIGLIDFWYEQIGSQDFSNLIDNYDSIPGINHFTQLIWAKTTHIGCARAVGIKNASHIALHITCNYGPAGNNMDEPIYRKGTGCSACPSGIPCNTDYPSLCGKIDNTDLIAGVNPYRAADIARGNQNSLHSSNLSIFTLNVFIVITYI